VAERVDSLLVRMGLARSRAIANGLVKSGRVLVNGQTIGKPSELVALDANIIITALPGDSVAASRAGGKLAGAIEDLRSKGVDIRIEGKDCLDIGASTGGFTQVLLENGAAQVIALDVGHGQLRPELRENPKVTPLERVNARYLVKDQLPFAPQFITCDVSFISLTMVFPAIKEIAQPGAQVLLLIKPQFEVGRGNLGKGGIVRNEKLIAQAIENVKTKADENGFSEIRVIPSKVAGTGGNQEYFLFGIG
jgi:23S rRNA (cytidine1920-2'-O)/16S rRNA (cytidine1409-2'-O)-methyltransferase